MSAKPIKTVQDVLELSKKYADQAKQLTHRTHPSSQHVSEYDQRQSLRYCIVRAETLLFNNIDEPLPSTIAILAGVSGFVGISALPKFDSAVNKVCNIGSTELGGQYKGRYCFGANNEYPVYLNNDEALRDKIVVVRFDVCPWSSNKAAVADACTIQIVESNAPSAQMPEELANSIFKECVRAYFPELQGIPIDDRGEALTRALREIKKAYADYMGGSIDE